MDVTAILVPAVRIAHRDCKSKVKSSGVLLSETERHETARSTELNAAFRSGKTEVMGLRKMYLCFTICRRVRIWSAQLWANDY